MKNEKSNELLHQEKKTVGRYKEFDYFVNNENGCKYENIGQPGALRLHQNTDKITNSRILPS